jgi:hypothetical protein
VACSRVARCADLKSRIHRRQIWLGDFGSGSMPRDFAPKTVHSRPCTQDLEPMALHSRLFDVRDGRRGGTLRDFGKRRYLLASMTQAAIANQKA